MEKKKEDDSFGDFFKEEPKSEKSERECATKTSVGKNEEPKKERDS